jgi:hypothetical protein
MPNLLIVVALVSYFWAHMPLLRDWREGLARARVLVGIGLVALLLQVVIASQAGISQASTAYARQQVAARLVVNLDRIPVGQRGCYTFYGEFGYLYFSPDAATFPGFAMARHDQLSVFTPALFRKYRAEGLPTIPPCKP